MMFVILAILTPEYVMLVYSMYFKLFWLYSMFPQLHFSWLFIVKLFSQFM